MLLLVDFDRSLDTSLLGLIVAELENPRGAFLGVAVQKEDVAVHGLLKSKTTAALALKEKVHLTEESLVILAQVRVSRLRLKFRKAQCGRCAADLKLRVVVVTSLFVDLVPFLSDALDLFCFWVVGVQKVVVGDEADRSLRCDCILSCGCATRVQAQFRNWA